jgi:hypothetical protein
MRPWPADLPTTRYGASALSKIFSFFTTVPGLQRNSSHTPVVIFGGFRRFQEL